MTRQKLAEELLAKHYSCPQVILHLFAGSMGLDKQTALRLAAPFSADMQQDGLCGVASAALMVIGAKYGFSEPDDRAGETLCRIKTEEFICGFMKGIEDIPCRHMLSRQKAQKTSAAETDDNSGCLQLICHAIRVLEQVLDNTEDIDRSDLESLSLETLPISASHNPEELEYGNVQRTASRAINKMLAFRHSIRHLVKHSQPGQVAFIQLDIDNFKVLNDLHGELFGNEILYYISQTLSHLCGEKQFHSRLRSDVFMIVTPCESKEWLDAFIGRLNDAMNSYKGIPFRLVFGVYIVEDPSLEIRQMEDRANIARKSVKGNALKNVAYYEDYFKESLYARKFIEDNMEEALEKQYLQMYLQPKYQIDTGQIIGAEALIRWQAPGQKMIMPDQFIPIFEDNGFVIRSDTYIWENACMTIRKWIDMGLEPVPISVNVSRLHFNEMNLLLETLTRLTGKYDIPRELLELEITESIAEMNTFCSIEQLHEAGFRILMDDFGSGYSTLNMLQDMNFDVIKIDRLFFRNLSDTSKGQIIVSQMIEMVLRLGLDIIAEGVETQAQAEFLLASGCNAAQGYYFSRPIPEKACTELLLSQQHKSV